MHPESPQETTCDQLLITAFVSGQIRDGHPDTALSILDAQQYVGGASICLEQVLTQLYGPAAGPISVEGVNEQGAPVTVPAVFGPAAACRGVCRLQQTPPKQY